MTISDKVSDEYAVWMNSMCTRCFFNHSKYKGLTAGTIGILNVGAGIILTPWFIFHRISFHNHNSHPFKLKNKVGWVIGSILAGTIDLFLAACSITPMVIGFHIKKQRYGLPINLTFLDFIICVLCFGVLYVSVCRIPDLFKRVPAPIEISDPEDEVEEIQEEVDEEEEEEIEELYFCQIIRLNSTTDLHIIKVEYCPDETAFIRIVTDESFTQPYKRKVMRDKRGERYINFNNEKYYLDPKKTQARMPE